jgi:hypothetical protein
VAKRDNSKIAVKLSLYAFTRKSETTEVFGTGNRQTLWFPIVGEVIVYEVLSQSVFISAKMSPDGVLIVVAAAPPLSECLHRSMYTPSWKSHKKEKTQDVKHRMDVQLLKTIWTHHHDIKYFSNQIGT